MSTITSTYYKVIQNQRVLVTGLMVIMGIAVTASFQLLSTDHAIVHCLYPLTRFGDNFVCRPPFL